MLQGLSFLLEGWRCEREFACVLGRDAGTEPHRPAPLPLRLQPVPLAIDHLSQSGGLLALAGRPLPLGRPSPPTSSQDELGSIVISYVIFAMDVTTVSPKFQVVIPKRVREQFGLSPGQTLQVLALPGRIELVPTQSPEELRGFLQGNNTFQREGDRL